MSFVKSLESRHFNQILIVWFKIVSAEPKYKYSYYIKEEYSHCDITLCFPDYCLAIFVWELTLLTALIYKKIMIELYYFFLSCLLVQLTTV